MRQDDETPHDSSAAGSPRVPLLARRDFRGGILALASGAMFLLSPRRSPPQSDEGAIPGLFAVVFLLPVGTLLVAAGVARWRGHSWGRVFHYLALLWPFLIIAIFSLVFGR